MGGADAGPVANAEQEAANELQALRITAQELLAANGALANEKAELAARVEVLEASSHASVSRGAFFAHALATYNEEEARLKREVATLKAGLDDALGKIALLEENARLAEANARLLARIADYRDRTSPPASVRSAGRTVAQTSAHTGAFESACTSCPKI